MKAGRHARVKILSVSLLLIVAGILISVFAGAKELNPGMVLKALLGQSDSLDAVLVREVRLPRVLSAALVGAVLAMCGALMQGITRNPITEPSIMGVTQGATLFMVISYSFPWFQGTLGRMGASFLGAILSGLLVMGVSILKNKDFGTAKLLLAGTAISTFFISIASVAAILTNTSQNLAFWVLGGFRTADWLGVFLLGLLFVAGSIRIRFLVRGINAVSLGDEAAVGLGVNPTRIRIAGFLVIIPLCAAAVAVAGNIAFVGLVIPQIAKRMVGGNYQQIIPFSCILGALLLIYSDLAARMVRAPYETPVGLFTALIGVPFFLYLLRREF